MSYEINDSGADCYKNTNCLINKLGIKDDNQLSILDADISYCITLNFEKNHIQGNSQITV